MIPADANRMAIRVVSEEFEAQFPEEVQDAEAPLGAVQNAAPPPELPAADSALAEVDASTDAICWTN